MKKGEGKSTAELFKNKEKQILKAWMKAQMENDTLREDLMSMQDLEEESSKILKEFIKAIQEGNYDDIKRNSFNELLTMLGDISRSRAIQGYNPREVGMFVFSLKDSLLEFMQGEYGKNAELLNSEIQKINVLLDSLGIHTFETFIAGREEQIDRQRRELVEVSTPVIKVWDGILALPIIGTMDSVRSQQIMEGLLDAIVKEGYDIAILDISGVPTVDTITAQHLLKTVNAAKLMGAECIVSGIRPEIAQTIVNLGVDIIGVTKTKSTMADAMVEAFSLLGMEVGDK